MYNLKVTREQAEVLTKVLDMFSRIGIGQLEEILRHPAYNLKVVTGEINLARSRRARELLNEVRSLITGQRQGGIGIPLSDEQNKIAYDILQVVQHRLAWDERPEGSSEIWFQEPMREANHPLAEIEEEEDV